VAWGGQTLFDQTNIAAIGWTNLQFTVSATGTNTVLEFGFRDDVSYLGLDDINLTLAASPHFAILSTSLFQSNLVLNGISGVSGRTYYVVASTNLALPYNQWKRVATNVLSADGNFTITATNAVNSNVPQQFYILSVH
jgi:hypothetical protein